MKIGVIGAGTMGRTHAAGWAEIAAGYPASERSDAPQLAGILAEPVEEARPLAEKYGCRAYGSLKELLADVDIVDVCTPTHLHREMTIAAFDHGRHVICEKPIARDLESARAMVAAGAKAGLRLFVAQVVRFFPEYAAAKRAVDEGRIGRVATQRLSRGSYRPRRAPSDWLLDVERSGGILLDFMIHDFDFARWIAGDVVSVYAKKASSVDPASPVDFAFAILAHESGALSHVQGSWAYPPPTFRTGFEISGDAGMIEQDSEPTSAIQHLLAAQEGAHGDVGVPSSPLAESPYTAELREFYDAILSGKEARVSGEDGVAALAIGLAAIESDRTGRAVGIEPAERPRR